jgi:hypothetical protein
MCRPGRTCCAQAPGPALGTYQRSRSKEVTFIIGAPPPPRRPRPPPSPRIKPNIRSHKLLQRPQAKTHSTLNTTLFVYYRYRRSSR